MDYHTYNGGCNGDMSISCSSSTCPHDPSNNNIGCFGMSTYTSYRNRIIDYPNGGASFTQCAAGIYGQCSFKDELSPGTLVGSVKGVQKLINDANNYIRSGTNTRITLGYPLTFAITEMNIDHVNPPQETSLTNKYENTFYGIGQRSFLAGQYWLDMMSSVLKNGGGLAEFVMPWSIREHGGDGNCTGSNPPSCDLGITKGAASSNITFPIKLPTYYHYEMIADNFRCCTTYYSGNPGGSGLTPTFKVFGAQGGNQMVVVILNEDETGAAAKNYSLALNCNPPSHASLWATMCFNSAPTTIYPGTINAASTQVLVFDNSGHLVRKVEYKESDGVDATPVYTFDPTYGSSLTAAELGADILVGSPAVCCPQLPRTLTSNPNMGNGYYQWYKSTGTGPFTLISGNNNQISATTTGIYKVVVNKNNCIAEDYISVSNGFCCGLSPQPRIANNSSEEIISSELFDNVPNPSAGTTTIYYNLADDISKAEIRITDIYGKTIERIPVSKENNNIEFNCSSCANGIYFYSLITDDRKINTKKMIIAK